MIAEKFILTSSVRVHGENTESGMEISIVEFPTGVHHCSVVHHGRIKNICLIVTDASQIVPFSVTNVKIADNVRFIVNKLKTDEYDQPNYYITSYSDFRRLHDSMPELEDEQEIQSRLDAFLGVLRET